MEIKSLAECVARASIYRLLTVEMWARPRAPCRAGISERLPVKSSCAKLNVKLTISVDSVEIGASFAA
jgi:hypothetical protein